MSKELRHWCDTEGLELDRAIALSFVESRPPAVAHGMLRWLARRAAQVQSAVFRYTVTRAKRWPANVCPSAGQAVQGSI